MRLRFYINSLQPRRTCWGLEDRWCTMKKLRFPQSQILNFCCCWMRATARSADSTLFICCCHLHNKLYSILPPHFKDLPLFSLVISASNLCGQKAWKMPTVRSSIASRLMLTCSQNATCTLSDEKVKCCTCGALWHNDCVWSLWRRRGWRCRIVHRKLNRRSGGCLRFGTEQGFWRKGEGEVWIGREWPVCAPMWF